MYYTPFRIIHLDEMSVLEYRRLSSGHGELFSLPSAREIVIPCNDHILFFYLSRKLDGLYYLYTQHSPYHSTNLFYIYVANLYAKIPRKKNH